MLKSYVSSKVTQQAVEKTRNSKILNDFVAYCKANPELRFWQALRNWSGYHFIFGSKNTHFDDFTSLHDTYYDEEK